MKQTQRPPANRRLEIIAALRESVAKLHTIYHETGHGMVTELIGQQESLLRKLKADEWWFHQEELAEAMAMLNELPYAVQTWLMDYKDKEMQ